MYIKKCEGNGQGSCVGCEEKIGWNRQWMPFLYKIKGRKGCYCYSCLKVMALMAAENIIIVDDFKEGEENDS